MEPNVKVAIITAAPPTVTALVAVWASIRNNKSIRAIHVDINSRMTQLLQERGKAERAEGVIQGTDAERAKKP